MVPLPSELPSPSVESAKESAFRTLSQTRGRDSALAEMAGRQYGVVARWQLLEAGFDPGAVGRRLRCGRLHRLYPGVYSVGHRVLRREGRWMGATLAAGLGAVLSHRSAAALWCLRQGTPGGIDVTCPHKSRSTSEIRRHCSSLPPDEIGESEDYPGIPVTTVPRTIFDLAATGDADLVESLLRQAERRRRWDRLSLPDLLDRYPHRRGTRAVRIALARIAEAPGETESPLEERFLPFLRRHRLPLPRLNEWIVLGDRRYRVDCRWPGTKEIVELDGWGDHGTRLAFQRDRERDRRLRVAGYGLTRLTWSQLDHEAEDVAADLRRLLASDRAVPRP